jgi:hypothetical protein
MNKETARYCEAFLYASATQLSSISRYVIRAFPPAQRDFIGVRFGEAFVALSNISKEIYEQWPELNPHLVDEKAAELRTRRSTRQTSPANKRHSKRSRVTGKRARAKAAR